MPVKNCFHVRLDGTRCGSPCLKRRNYCYFHFRMMQRAHVERQLAADSNNSSVELPFLEDLRTVQVALTDVLRAVAAGRIPREQASILIRGLRFASQILRDEDLSGDSHKKVREAEDSTSEREAFDHVRLPVSQPADSSPHSSENTHALSEFPLSSPANSNASGDFERTNEGLSNDQLTLTKKLPKRIQSFSKTKTQ